MPSFLRTFFALCVDALLLAVSWYAAFLLRFNFVIPEDNQAILNRTLFWVCGAQLAIFFLAGLYRRVWKYSGLPELRLIAISSVLGLGSSALLLLLLRQATSVPRSVWVLNLILVLIFVAGSRVLYRMLSEYRRYGYMHRSTGQPVIVLGAGNAGVSLLKDIQRNPHWQVVGILDDDTSLKGRVIYGAKILGTFEKLPSIAKDVGAAHAIIAIPSASALQKRRALELCTAAKVEALTVPSFNDLMTGRVEVSQLRKVEVEDLLGRDPVELEDSALASLIQGKCVMVTGAGGSIGSELCRQIAAHGPKLLIFFEKSEPSLFFLEQEFVRRNQSAQWVKPVQFKAIVGDVCDNQRLAEILELYKPEIVFHAAAYKHVPLMEVDNCREAVRNNVLGTYTLAKECSTRGVKKFILISTDKAVNPCNVMGATKRLAEKLCQGLQEFISENNTTSFITVRFGNVLGSQGSVIPVFRDQISRGGPVTVTHENIERYFMSIPEASQLVLHAAALGEGGEIFVLDMGKPVKIIDLAREMIRLSGFSEAEIPIKITGLRPGEKMYEELFGDGERVEETQHPKLRRAKAQSITKEWTSQCLDFIKSQDLGDQKVRDSLRLLLKEYRGELS